MNVDEYLYQVPSLRIEKMRTLMNLIRSLYPVAELSMKCKMPTFTHGAGWVVVANQKHYLSLYTCSAEYLKDFKEKHPKIKTGKGCINFRDRDDIPLDDLTTVIRSAMEFRH